LTCGRCGLVDGLGCGRRQRIVAVEGARPEAVDDVPDGVGVGRLVVGTFRPLGSGRMRFDEVAAARRPDVSRLKSMKSFYCDEIETSSKWNSS